jgi:WhiB family redox-sensing transcriptional regulator
MAVSGMTRGKIQPLSAPRSFVDGLLAGQPDWQEALCAQVDPDLFYPERGGDSHGSVRTAKQLCFACDDRPQCLQYAMENRERIGVWGGTTPKERSRLARERGIDWSAYRPRPEMGVGRVPSMSEAVTEARRRNVAVAREAKKRGAA